MLGSVRTETFAMAVAFLFLNVPVKGRKSVGVAIFSSVSALFKGELLLEKMLESLKVVTANRPKCT